MDRIDRLTALFKRRWACPVLAELASSGGAKFITLVNRLGSNPGAMRQTLNDLIDLGWIRRNPGYGHPLRPEYILTPRGERLAHPCAALAQAFRDFEVEDVALRKWSMPVLHVIGEGPTRFSEVARALDGVTDRALSLTLRDLSGVAIVERNLVAGPPVRSTYAASNAGSTLLPILELV